MGSFSKLAALLTALLLAANSPLFAGSAFDQLKGDAGDEAVAEIEDSQGPLKGKVVKVKQDPNAVLGIFEGADDTLFWFVRDAGFSSKSVREHLKKSKMGSRDVGEMLRELKSGWLVMRDAINDLPHYTFIDPGTQSVFYLPIDAIVLGEEQLPRGPLTMEEDSLVVAFGSKKAGTVVYQRFSPEYDADSGEVGIVTLAVFEYKGGKLAEAMMFEAGGLRRLLTEDELGPLAQDTGNGAPLAKMVKFLETAENPSIQAVPSGATGRLYKLREDGVEKLYIYVKGDVVKEFPVR